MRRQYACRVLDWGEYFRRAGWGEETSYFLPADAKVDLDECLAEYELETLTEYLLGRGVDFATLGDCHMDDSCAVSYGTDFWNCGADRRAFIL